MRFELLAARSFIGTRSLQDTIDLAVRDFLDGMYATEGFLDALHSAERSQQSRAGLHVIGGSEAEHGAVNDPNAL